METTTQFASFQEILNAVNEGRGKFDLEKFIADHDLCDWVALTDLGIYSPKHLAPYFTDFDAQIAYKGYTYGTLKQAFAAVQNPTDWKAPIAVWVPGEAVLLAVAAIEFFTATTVQVALDQTRMKYHLESEGYRMGPAGDH